MSPDGAARRIKHMSTPLRPRTTTAFFTQSMISFAISRSVTAKCIRDRQEETALVSRVDQARLDKLLTEQDLLRVEDH